MGKRNVATRALLAGAGFSLLLGWESHAQEVDAIIVTAQKRAENVQDVPLSITALNGERLERAGVTSPERLEFVAPNVAFAQSGADARVSIRGVSSSGIEINADPVVGFFVDGVYQSRTAQALAGFVDIERVEVVRGPQGTLYGRNTTGGSINIISKAPTDEFEFGAQGLVGDYEHLAAQGFVNVPLSDAVAVRLAGLREVRDGWAENLFRSGDANNDEDQLFLRGSALFKLSPDAELVLRANYWKQEGQGSGFNAYKVIGQQEVFDGSSNRTNPFAAFFSTAGVDPGGNPADPYEFSNDIKAVRDIEQNQISATFKYDFGSVALTSITAYNQFDRFTRQDSDFTELSIFDVDVTQDVATFTQEVQIASDGEGPLQWVAGLYYLQDDVAESFVVRILPDSNLGFLGPFLINRAGDAKTDSFAVFGQAAYALTPNLRATLGARWTQDKKDFELVNVGVNISESETFSETTWRAALDYKLAERTLAYGYVATGFKSGGFNLTAFPAYDPETVTTYEIGLKHTLARRGLINVAAFWSDYQDLQVNSFDAATVSSYTQNAAEATIKGVELEGEWRPGAWLFAGSVSYQDATYGDFIVSNPFAGPALINLEDRSLPRAPEWSAKFSIGRDFDLGPAGTITPLVQVSYFDDQYLTEFNQTLDRQDAYTKTDARLFWRSSEDRYSAEAFITNIEDEAVLISGVYGPGAGLFANYGAPRTFGLRFGYNY